MDLKTLASWRPGRLARNTAHAGVWSVARIGVQGISLILLARLLGAQGYGALAGAMGLYMSAAPLVGLGSGTVLVRHLVRDGDVGRLASTQAVFILSGLALFALLWPLSLWLLPGQLPALALALLAFAELVVAPALVPLAMRHVAEERMSVAGGLQTAAPIARCIAAALALAFGARSLDTFAALYLASLVLTVALVFWRFKPVVRGSWSGLRNEVREGLPYAVSMAVRTSGSEIDKTMMLRFAGATLTGQYSAAARVVQAATLPVVALIVAAGPRWFRDSKGLSGPLFLAAGAYALLAAGGLWLAAPLLPLLLGSDFAASVPVLRLMCLLVLTGTMRDMMGMRLTVSDRQAARNWVEIVAIAAGFALMPLLIPRWGATGVVGCLLLTDTLLIVLGAWVLRERGERAG
jgi:O-antigen/teichoic acid export membrane protein